MTAIETLEAAIARLESLRDRAFPGPYEPGVGGGDHWYLFANDESVAYISANDGSDEEHREPTARLLAALSRTVDSLISMHRRSVLAMKAAIGAGMSEADVHEIAERSGELALARSVLGVKGDAS